MTGDPEDYEIEAAGIDPAAWDKDDKVFTRRGWWLLALYLVAAILIVRALITLHPIATFMGEF